MRASVSVQSVCIPRCVLLDSGLSIVLKLLPSAADVVYVSDFAFDDTDFRHSEHEAKLKSAIESGRTVVLVNGSRMYSSLYDVLNKNYQVFLIAVSANALVTSFPR